GVDRLVHEQELLVVVGGGFDVEAGRAGADAGELAAVTHGAFAAGGVDEDAAHAFGGGGEKMRAVGPRGLNVAAEAEPSFVDEGGGLQRLAGRFARELGGGELTQLFVNERKQLLRRLGI